MNVSNEVSFQRLRDFQRSPGQTERSLEGSPFADRLAPADGITNVSITYGTAEGSRAEILEKFPGLTQPDETYHGIVYTQKLGKGAYITKATAQLMRDLGSIQSPQNAFLLNIGLETLHLRMPRHCENALKAAKYLKDHEKVAWVNHPSLAGDKYYDLAQKYMPKGTCGVLTFGLKGGRDAAVRMMDSLQMIAIVTHVADARSCVLHPASHTHRQMNDAELMEAGVQPDLIRFSVGIENIEDIIADLKQALLHV